MVTVGQLGLELGAADPGAVERAVEAHSPEVVINAAAYTNVDGCETELAYRVNALGPRDFARSRARRGCELVHVGTNNVFDGEENGPSTLRARSAPTAAPGWPGRSS